MPDNGWDSLQSFLNKEFSALGCPQEAKWVLEDLRPLDSAQAHDKAQEILLRRKAGEPLAYILGHWDFRKLRLSVGKGVLIPRPETEELVDHVLKHIKSCSLPGLKIADLGAGTGALAYSLAQESHVDLEVYAVEKSPEAFFYLEKNRAVLSSEQQKRMHLIPLSWEEAKVPMLDVIVSNPPYVSLAEYAEIDEGVRSYEPKCALVPTLERDPMSAYTSILELARKCLKPGGAIFFEFGPAQEGLWSPYMEEYRWELLKDLSGKPRFLYAFDFKPKSR